MAAHQKALMKIAWLIFAIILICSCARTTEKLLTAKDLCRSLEKMQDPENYRDQYDNCMLFTEEELTTPEGCEGHCRNYCTKITMDLKEYLIGFGGCRCTCVVTLR
jgi:hypothetical protein